jgi:hypothetical protein
MSEMTKEEFSRRLADAIQRERENPRPPMFHEIMASGADEETAMFVARMLRKNGYFLVNPDHIGWPEIHAFREEIRGGQDYREDAGGFFVRCIAKLIGFGGSKPDEVITHQMAAKRLLQRVDVA